MRRNASVALATLILLASCRTPVTPGFLSPRPDPAGLSSQRTTPAKVAIPPGAVVPVTLNHVVGPTVNRVGDRFYATVAAPLANARGEVIVPEGATVSGRITGLSSHEPADDQMLVRLNFDRISWRGRARPFSADVISVSLQPMRAWQANLKAASAAPAPAGVTDNLIAVEGESYLPVGARLMLRARPDPGLK